MPRLFFTGWASDGQMGETEEHEGADSFSVAVEVKKAPENIKMIASGVKHSLFLTSDGEVFSVGGNECGQLGRDEYKDESFDIAKVTLKGGVNIIQIASGHFHNAAVSDDGRIFMWGANHTCQCGEAASAKIPTPQRIYSLTSVVQVDCGDNTTVVLTEACSVFVFGLIADKHQLPLEIEFLSMLPIIQIAAGGSHFAALTASGQLCCWGKNTNGQITGKISDKFSTVPTIVQNLSKVIYVACGSKHTVVLTTEGRIFTFGNNSQGQLGDWRREDSVNVPKSVTELLGTTITGIACGSRYTLAISNGAVYAFGLNNTGQLGIGNFSNCGSPTLVKNMNSVKSVYGGVEHSFFLVDDIGDLPIHPVGAIDKFKVPKFLTFNHLRRIFDANDKLELIGEIESVFSSVGCLNGSFLYEDDRRYLLGNTSNGLNLDDVMHAMNMLANSTAVLQFSDIIINSLENCEIFNLQTFLTASEPNLETLRIFFLLIWIPSMQKLDKKHVDDFLLRYTLLLSRVADATDKLFENWWNVLPIRHFNRFAMYLMNMLEYLFPTYYENTSMLRPILKLINRMATVNRSNEKIPYTHFYLNSLEDHVNVRKDYLSYYLYHNPNLTADGINVPRGPDPFFWFHYPCLMNVVAKSNILETHSKVQMHTAIQHDYHRNILENFLMGAIFADPYLHFTVRRQNIVHDAITELMTATVSDIAKPLKVQFQGEEGEDEGGVRKEFFMLLYQELLQPTYGMFVEDDESHLVWFSGFPVEKETFAMVGTLCVMAIYNSVLVELPFPLALYKYLLDMPFTLEDLLELHPSEGRSLEHLLAYDGDDVEDTFMLNFEMSMTVFGHTEQVELKQGGKDIPVTNANRSEFVELYVKRRLALGKDDYIKVQLDEFKKGFMKLLDTSILSLFQPRELMELMSGNENYDWEALRENCAYKEYYHKDHPAIKAFWEAFFMLEEEQRKKFLLFLMGTTRIPWKGMSKVEMIIQPTDEAKLPVAHTCFNLLDLPPITDKQEMLRRLNICIDNNQGFTLV